jgi:O-antigen/teichoic acid export membrane protein
MRVIRDGTIYLGAGVANKLVPFLLLPLVTRYLSPAEYGRWSVFLVANGLTLSVVGMAMHTNIASNFYSETRAEMAAVIGNVVLVLLATTALALVPAALLAAWRPELFSVPTRLLALTPLLALLSMLGTLYTTILRNQRRPLAFAGFQLGQMALNVAVMLVLLVAVRAGWLAQVGGLAVSGAVFALVAVVAIRRQGYLDLHYDRGKVRDILALSLPLVPHALGGAAIAFSDRLFIEHLVGLDAVGLYALGYSFGMAMGIVTDAAIRAWTPWVYRVLAAPTDIGKRQVVQSCYALIGGFFLAAGVLALGARWALPYVVDEAYRGAAAYIGWVALGYAIRGAYQVFFPFLVHTRRTHFLVVSTATAAAVNLALNYVLIGRYGPIGGAYATIVAFAVSAALVFWYQKRHYPMPWGRPA